MLFKPKTVILHNTKIPSLWQRPNGFQVDHIENLYLYYFNEKGWSGCPHFFVDDRCVHSLFPVSRPGVHCVGWNDRSIGIEVLGDYDKEDPENGRGLGCWQNAAQLLYLLRSWFPGIGWMFHREADTSRNCPGQRVTRAFFEDLLEYTRPKYDTRSILIRHYEYWKRSIYGHQEEEETDK